MHQSDDSSVESVPISPLQEATKPLSRFDIFQEKMHLSSDSIEFVWDDEDDCDVPALKAISMTSLSLGITDDEDEPLRVRFSANIDCQAYIHIFDYSSKESIDCFYTSAERKLMTAERDLIIAKIDRGINEEAEDEILRGLEYWCKASSKHIDKRVDAVIQLTMDEQDRQIDNHVFDEYNLSVSAQNVTAKSTKAAQKMAKEDARLAQEAYLDMAHNGSVGSYMMPATLCAFELNKGKSKSKRRRSSKKGKRSKVEGATPSEELTLSEEFTVPKKVKNEKKKSTNEVTEKEAKKTRKGQKERRKSDATEKSSKSTKSKKSKTKKSNNKAPKKPKRTLSVMEPSTIDDKDTVTTAPMSQETLATTKQLSNEHGSLSSDEDDTFLIFTKKEKKSTKPPARRHTLTGPGLSVPMDDDRPLLSRGFSWWNLPESEPLS